MFYIIIIMTGLLLFTLQIYLSVKRSDWVIFLIPIIYFVFSLVVLFIAAISGVRTKFSLFMWLSCNVPTIVFLSPAIVSFIIRKNKRE